MADPKSSIDALFPEPIDCGFGVTVHPLTLAHYALLEKIDSYLVNPNHAPDSLEVIKTLYICSHCAADVMTIFPDLDYKAMEWAEKLPPMLSDIIAKAILKQISAMSKVQPIIDDKKKLMVPATVS